MFIKTAVVINATILNDTFYHKPFEEMKNQVDMLTYKTTNRRFTCFLFSTLSSQGNALRLFIWPTLTCNT